MREPAGELAFSDVPLWMGIHPNPSPVQRFPLSLGLHKDGFIYQTTVAKVRDAVIAAYGKESYSFITPPPGTSLWADDLLRRKLSLLLAENRSFENLRVLEIGAANMELGRTFVEKFGVARYVVVDPALKERSSDLRLRGLQGYFPHSDLLGERFDLIISLSCLEHVPDPVSFLTAIRGLLHDEQSLVYLTLPDIGKQFTIGDMNAILHEHLNYFDVPSFSVLASGLGLRISRHKVSADLLSCLLQKDNPTRDNPVVNGHLFSTACGSFPLALKTAAERVKKDISDGKTIAFYGANNGLNCFLDYNRFAPCERIAVVDGDRAKAGLKVPTADIAIQFRDQVEFERFDKIYVSATSFYDEIRADIGRLRPSAAAAVLPLFG